MSNRQQRRHPQHPSISIQYPSKKRVIDKKKEKTSNKKDKPLKNNQKQKTI